MAALPSLAEDAFDDQCTGANPRYVLSFGMWVVKGSRECCVETRLGSNLNLPQNLNLPSGIHSSRTLHASYKRLILRLSCHSSHWNAFQ